MSVTKEEVIQFIENMTAVFREVRRVLKKTGTCWVNFGDSYSGNCSRTSKGRAGLGAEREGIYTKTGEGLKTKDLVGIPWMFAFALRADGWYLRQDIIWSKPNPMPESVQDRCTKSHEYIFLLTKSGKYFYDAEAIMEDCIFDDGRPAGVVRDREYGYDSKQKTLREQKQNMGAKVPSGWDTGAGSHDGLTGRYKKPRQFVATKQEGTGRQDVGRTFVDNGKRNKRSVWEIATQPYPGAHFATFPKEIPKLCITAGCPMGGVVLDPFSGSGTTGEVATGIGRYYIGIDLNKKYESLAKERLGLFV